jgi:hypothetical protein
VPQRKGELVGQEQRMGRHELGLVVDGQWPEAQEIHRPMMAGGSGYFFYEEVASDFGTQKGLPPPSSTNLAFLMPIS